MLLGGWSGLDDSEHQTATNTSGLFSQLSITLTLQVCDFAVLLLLQLGVFLAMGLQCLTMFQFQAVVLQLQVKQLLLDIFVLVLNMKSGNKDSVQAEEK